MRKWLAYFLGVFTVLMLGSVFLHESLLLIGDWLGPIVGAPIYGVLTMAFLLLGDPFSFVSLLFIWTVTALLVGAIVRRRLGAVLVGLLVWLTLLPITAASVWMVLLKIPQFSQGSGPLASLPPIPPGLSISQILQAPILGKVIQAALSSASSNSGSGAFMDVLIGLARDLALKPVIIVVGALIGVEAGRLVQRRVGPSPPPRSTPKAAALLIVLAICVSQFAPLASAQTGSAYMESLVGYLDKSGKAYVGGVFLKSNPSIPGIDFQGQEGQGLAAALVVSQVGIGSLIGRVIPGGKQGGASSLTNLLPQTFAVVAYVGQPPDVAAEKSGAVSAALSTVYGVDLTRLTAITIPEAQGSSGQQVSFVLYGSGAAIGEFAKTYLSQVESGGLADTFKSAVSNGRLIPGSNAGSASGSMFMAGFVNISTFTGQASGEQLPPQLQPLLGQYLSGSVEIAASVSYWSYGVQGQGNEAALDVMDLLGLTQAPSFSPDSTLGAVALVVPRGKAPGNAPNAELITSTPFDKGLSDAFNSTLQNYGYLLQARTGVTELTAQDFRLAATGAILPLKLIVTKAATGGNLKQITVTVENQDTRPATGVFLDDSGSMGNYTSAHVVAGSTTANWESIQPGESRSLTYTLALEDPGVYTLGASKLTYSAEGNSFNDTSSQLVAISPRPLSVLVPFELAGYTFTAGTTLFNDLIPGYGAVVVLAIIAVFAALITIDGWRSYRRFKLSKAREADRITEEPSPGGGPNRSYQATE